MTTTTRTTKPSVWRRWPDWVAYAAAGWAAVYATIAQLWVVTGDGFPFGEGDPDSIGLLRNLPADIGAPVFAAVLAATTVLALVMAGGARVGQPYRTILQTLGWLVAAGLLLAVPEPGILALAGYAPVLLVGAPFGWPASVDYSAVFTWPLANQFFSIVGGFLVAGTVLAWQRRTRGACTWCGRSSGRVTWTEPAVAARWGRWAAYIAMAVPLLYAATRFSWLVGIPFTVTDEFVDSLHDSGAVWAGAWLATFAVIGAVLTLGLVQRWGERFPRWMLGLAGRRVPVPLAVVPAAVVSVMVTSAGLGLIVKKPELGALDAGGWVHLPQLLWPVWGVALAAATLAYYLRRRGRCSRCGRPDPRE